MKIKPLLKSTNNQILLLVLIVIVGIWARWRSVGYNIFPHGDMYQEVFAARQLFTTGLFAIPFPGAVHETVADITDNVVLSDKPPLWITCLATIHSLFGTDTFYTAKLLSFILGIISIPLMYLLANKFTSTKESLITTAIYTSSYLMIDVAGNGSRYMLQIVLIQLLLLVLLQKRTDDWRRAAFLGLLLGLGFMVNYPFLSVAPAIWGVLYFGSKTKKRKLLVISMFISILTISPWIIYNLYFYKTPLLATNLTRITQDVVREWRIDRLVLFTPKIQDSLDTYGLNLLNFWFSNGIFLLKKIQVLLPILPLFYVVWLIKWKHIIKSRNSVIFFCFSFSHILMFISWRTLKFRYFTSMYPLFLLAGLIALQYLKPKFRYLILIISLAFTLFISAQIYRINDYHTYYYDGILTEDQFRGAGEIDYMNRLTEISNFAKILPRDGIIATDLERAYFSSVPIYLRPPLSKEIFTPTVTHYKIKYLWTEEAISKQDQELLSLELVKSSTVNYLYQTRIKDVFSE